MSNKIPK